MYMRWLKINMVSIFIKVYFVDTEKSGKTDILVISLNSIINERYNSVSL